MRLACLDAPSFPLQAAVRAHPELRQLTVPWAVYAAEEFITELSAGRSGGASLCKPNSGGSGVSAKPPPRGVITASRAAVVQGVRRGSTLAQARAVCPELQLVALTVAELQAASEALLAAAGTVSPEVEAGPLGVAFAEIERVAHLFGGEVGTALSLRATARRAGFEAKVAIAGTRLAARAAARKGSGAEVIAPNGELAYLSPLSLALLDPTPELATTLERWGLATLGDFSRLPRDGIGARLGPEGVRLHRLACGEEVEPWQPLGQLAETVERIELEWGATQVEQLVFAAKVPIERLLQGLSAQGLWCDGLVLRLSLDPHGTVERELELAAPTRDLALLLTLLRSLLERHPPEAPVLSLKLVARSARGRTQQHGLFGLPSVSPEELGATLGRVEAVVGAGQLGSPALVDTHLPTEDNCKLARFEPLSLDGGRRGCASGAEPDGGLGVSAKPSPRASRQATLRLYRPPRAAEVLVERDRLSAIRAESLAGRVIDCAGPWSVEANWWGQATALDCYDVTLSDGGAYRVAFDRRAGTWLVQGEYD